MERYVGGAIAVICGSATREGKQNTVKLTRTINEIYRINAALRTRIFDVNGEPMQTVADYSERDVAVLQFNDKEELHAYADKYTKQPVNFHGELCEISAVVLPDSYGFIIKLHHIIGDAWSLSLVASQFFAIIDGQIPLAYPYEEYVAKETEYLHSDRYAKDKAFFMEQFQKCAESTYLCEKNTESFAAERKTFIIDTANSRLIRDHAQAHQISPFMLFLAALAVYFSRVKMNAEQFYIGAAVLNRSGVKEKNTTGMFINTVPILAEMVNEQSFAENLSALQKSVMAVFRHQRYNYGDILSDIRKEHNFSERLYDVMLSYQNAKIRENGEAESVWYHNGAQVESLQIHIDDRDGDGFFKIQYDYQTAKFSARDIGIFHEHICRLLFDALAHDAKKLYEIDFLTADEQQKLLYDFNDTAAEYPRDKCVHTLFEEQVAKTPDKTAVIACDKTLTYKELNEQANRIAHGLIAKGVSVYSQWWMGKAE